MAQLLDAKEIVNLEEVLMSQIAVQDALVNLLERKGIIAKPELLEEIKSVKAQMAKLKG